MTLMSTGFTTVVQYCSMSESSECCCGNGAHRADAPRAAGISLAGETASCFTQTIAGGLNKISGTTQTANTEDLISLEVLPADSGAISSSLRANSTLCADVEKVPSPGVAIYIRVNSILI